MRCLVLILVALIIAGPLPVPADTTFGPLESAGIADRLGALVPQDLMLSNERGAPVRLGDYFGERPLLLAPVDFSCGNICGVTLGGLFQALDDLGWVAGRDFAVLVVGLDPQATPAEARAAKATYLERGDGAAAAAAHFLSGDARPLMEAIGYGYAFDPKTDQFAHAAAVAVLGSDGRLMRWLYGYPFATSDIRLALTDAGAGTLGTFADRLWLLCYRYDPASGSYSFAVLTALKAGGALTALGLGGFIVLALRRERGRSGPSR